MTTETAQPAARNIRNIAKADLLATAISEQVVKTQAEVDAAADMIKLNPFSFFDGTYGDGLYRNAARLRALQRLHAQVAYKNDSGTPYQTEWTMEDINAFAREQARGVRAVPRSTCGSANMLEQNLLEIWLEIAGLTYSSSFLFIFRNAQREDAEYKAAVNAELAQAQIERAAKAEEAELKTREERNRKERERRAAKKAEAAKTPTNEQKPI